MKLLTLKQRNLFLTLAIVPASLAIALPTTALPTNSVAQATRQPPNPVVLQYFQRNRRQLGVCKESNQPEAAKLSETHRIQGQRFLVVYRCFLGAYQGAYEFYLYNRSGSNVQVKPLTLTRFEENATGQLVRVQSREVAGLPDYNPNQRLVSIFTKSRGLGDCGHYARYKLDGEELKLQEYRVKVDCDGRYVDPRQYPKIYP